MANFADGVGSFADGVADSLGGINDVVGSAASGALDQLNAAQDFLNSNKSYTNNDGFTVPPAYSADGNGLPYTKVPSNRESGFKRNIITWFIPEFGLVRMYVNPQNITYDYKKLITKTRTKGGYTLQYWGEELTTINIGGTTGSAGIEGINMLYEMYRAEQYANDGIALSLAAANSANDLANQGLNAIGGALESSLFGASAGGGLLGGLLGADSPSANALSAKNITTMAQLAFGVEMFYGGWVYRGFFENMNVTESADNFLLNYRMSFVATQRRGYRLNYFPWSRSANNGPSDYGTPNSFFENGDLK